MQLTALPDSGTTRRTGDGGYLFESQSALLHSRRIRLHSVANLFKSVHSALSGRRELACSNEQASLELELVREYPKLSKRIPEHCPDVDSARTLESLFWVWSNNNVRGGDFLDCHGQPLYPSGLGHVHFISSGL